jgi:hypothetical protein
VQVLGGIDGVELESRLDRDSASISFRNASGVVGMDVVTIKVI